MSSFETATRPRRSRAVLAGVAATALGLGGAIVYPDEPAFVAEPEMLAAFYRDSSSTLLLADTLYLLSSVLLLVFAAALWSAARRAEGGDGLVAATALTGAVAGVAVSLAAASFDIVGALRVEERGDIAPEIAAVMWDASAILYGLAAPMAFAVLVLGTAVLSLRGLLLPRWHGALSALLGVAMLIPPINYIAIIVFIFWVLLTSLLMYVSPPATASGPATKEATDGQAVR